MTNGTYINYIYQLQCVYIINCTFTCYLCVRYADIRAYLLFIIFRLVQEDNISQEHLLNIYIALSLTDSSLTFSF